MYILYIYIYKSYIYRLIKRYKIYKKNKLTCFFFVQSKLLVVEEYLIRSHQSNLYL